MVTVFVNQEFMDLSAGKLRKYGDKIDMTKARANEIKAVNPNLITILGEVEIKPKKKEA